MLKYLCIFFLFAFTACSKDAVEDDTIFGVTWKINYFYDGAEMASDYAGFYFMFNEDGTFMAHEGPRLTIGRWSESNSRFIILFDTNPPLLKLKGEWSIIEKTSSVIKLKDEVAAPNKELHLIRQ
jgi:hypothetical protein